MNSWPKHPSANDLLASVDGELSAAQNKRVQAHLRACWACRKQVHEIENTISKFVSLHETVTSRQISPGGPSRALLAARINASQSAQNTASRSFWLRSRLIPTWIAIPRMNPLLMSAAVLGVASVVLFLFWLRSTPSMSAEDLLQRAGALSMQAESSRPGVVYQRIRIRTPKSTFERTLYRDTQERRQAKQEVSDSEQTHLESKLVHAGVNWDKPLLAASYKVWHDEQRVVRDTVRKENGGLLCVTTVVSSGPISQESITIREADLHTVARTVTFRDSGSVEIAELNYAVLRWDAVNDSLFEPSSPRFATAQPHLPILPHLLTRTELDEAELEVRAVLAQLHADSSERIIIDRRANAVQVKGIVETEERKRQLQFQLRPLSHVEVSISTFGELEQHPVAGMEITSVKASSLASPSSPLEQYWFSKGGNREDASRLHSQFFNALVTLKQSSNAIAELTHKFGGEPLTPASRDTLNRLIESHRKNLLSALHDEENAIAELDSSAAHDSSITLSPDKDELVRAVEHDVELCNELISENDAEPRRAQAILPQLQQSVLRIRAVLSRETSKTLSPQ